MSAFAVIYNRSGTPVDSGVLERVMQRLSHRGPDGSDVLLDGHIAMGHWHFWTTPEEVGEHQPLTLPDLPFALVFDGRLDNRTDLFSRLSIIPDEGHLLSDAALILRAYAAWGERCFEYFVGEFALVIFDQIRYEIVCARDQIGERTLFYADDGMQLVIASEPWAVAAALKIKPRVNDSAVAHYFMFRIPVDGQTFFDHVYELFPAHIIKFSAQTRQSWRYWQPDPTRFLRGQKDEEYAEQFRALLEISISSRLRSTKPVGVLMSGGLDSTSVACLAARMIAPQTLTTLSYVFDELSDCDERQYINAVSEKWGIRSVQIPCDDAWPYKDWQSLPRNLNHPEGNSYRLIKERAYARAHQEDLQVLLTGSYGDHLYSAARDWLADLLIEGRYLDAWKEWVGYTRKWGLRKGLSYGHHRRFARRLVDSIHPGALRGHRKPNIPIWLHPAWMGMLKQESAELNPVFERYGNLLNAGSTGLSPREIPNANQHSLELRHPYLDRRLVEFVLALPAYQLYYRTKYKYILRNALRGILPEVIRMRPMPTSLLPLYFRGVERESAHLAACFDDSESVWQNYVRAEWLKEHWNVVVPREQDGPDVVVPWLCFSYQIWHHNISG